MNTNHPLDLSMDGFGGVPRQPRVPYSAPGATLESNPQQQDLSLIHISEPTRPY